MNECEVSPCGEVPYANVYWRGDGSKLLQGGVFCKTHADELWEAIQPLVAANQACYWIFPLHFDVKEFNDLSC